MNILFVRLSYIGDILHATPAARWIKEQHPDAKLHWIVTPSMVELLDGNPYVDEIIPGNGMNTRHILKNCISRQCGACGGS